LRTSKRSPDENEALGQRRVTGDGAYDRRGVYRAVGEAGVTGVEIVHPPRRPATVSVKTTGPWKRQKPAYRADCRDRKTSVAEGNRLPAAGPRRGHSPRVQTNPRRQPPCEGGRGAAARSDEWCKHLTAMAPERSRVVVAIVEHSRDRCAMFQAPRWLPSGRISSISLASSIEAVILHED